MREEGHNHRLASRYPPQPAPTVHKAVEEPACVQHGFTRTGRTSDVPPQAVRKPSAKSSCIH